MRTGKSNLAIRLVLLAYLILGAWYSIASPIFEISDEVWHYPMVQHIAAHRQLPVQTLEPGAETGPWRQEGSQPPLYYLLAAGLTAWIDTSDMPEVRQINPQAQAGLVRADAQNINLVLHDPAREAFPWSGTVLAVHLIRLFSVTFGAWSVWLTWKMVRRLYPEPTWLADTAAAAHAFTPMFIFISASVNNDALVIPLASATLLQLLVLLQEPQRSWKTTLLLGATLGAAILTKKSALGLVPLTAAASVWSTWRNAGRPHHATSTWLRMLVAHLLGWGIPMLLISGWWFGRNYQLYGDWLGLNAFLNSAGVRPFAPTPLDLWNERFSFLAAYWGNFGALNVLMPTWIYSGLNYLALMTGLSLCKRCLQWLRSPKFTYKHLWPFCWDSFTAARAIAWVWPVTVFVSLLRWTSMTLASQGRLIFPAISIVSLGLVFGASSWIPARFPKARFAVALALTGLFFMLSVSAPWLWIMPAYRVPPPLTETERAAIPYPVNATFDEALKLLGHTAVADNIHPGETLTLELYWEALRPTTEDHLIFIHLLGEGGRIVAQYDGFPKRGLRSTNSLQAGAAWVERYSLTVPRIANTPDTLSISIGVYNRASGVRMLTQQGTDTVQFGAIYLRSDPVRSAPEFTMHFGKGMALTNYVLSAPGVMPGQTLHITLFWECNAPMSQDYTVSLQIIDDQWHKAAQNDHWPQGGTAPTSTWRTGQKFEDTIALTVAPEATPGIYKLLLSVYYIDADGAIQHLPIQWEAHQTPVDTVTLTQVQVKAPE